MPAPVIVYKDVGGLVSDYEARTEQYRRENREVRLHECRSACTLALSLPNVCVYPDAKVKFHQAYNAINRETDLGVSSRLFSSYPTAVQARLGYLTREYRVLTGTELIALGMRNCEGDNSIMVASRKQRGPSTSVASARPNGDSSLAPFGDIAHKVQTAVASALTGTAGQTAAPIRVAVADRQTLSDLQQGKDGAASVLPAIAPLPPRRPPSEAFAAQEFAAATPAYQQLINGAQPILGRQFTRAMAAN